MQTPTPRTKSKTSPWIPRPNRIRTALAMLPLALCLWAAVPTLLAGKIAFVTGDQYISQGGNADIWVVDDDGANMAPLIQNPAAEIAPAFSPDGQHIAFLSDRGGTWAIYTANADGTNQQIVPNSEFSASDLGEGSSILDWSPDGTRLVYRATNDAGGMGVINADGTNKIILTTNGVGDGVYNSLQGMSWGPTGDEIMVHAMDYPWHQNVFRYTVSASVWDQMTLDATPSHIGGGIAVNASGQVVFSRRASYDQLYDLYIMNNVPGGPATNLTNLSIPNGAFFPDWMGGDQGVTFAYNTGPGSHMQIGTIDADGTDFALFSPPPGMLLATDPTWTPEPTAIALLLLLSTPVVRRAR
ncbi:MAG: PD40 domain-containing protein [Phycisphaerae bacterium]|nr:PD40 domain-containing protein [Phycisphaerae bacterium]